MLRVLIADDYPISRKGLKQILHEAEVEAFVGEVASAADALRALQAEDWDVCVLSATLPDGDPVGMLAKVKRACPSLPVVVLGFIEARGLQQLFTAAGAADYLAKTAEPEKLVATLQTAAAQRVRH